MFILVLFQIKQFSRIKFYVSWWAYSFPMDALVIGTLLMYHETGMIFFKIASWATFVMLNGIILLLIYKTTKAIKNKSLCVEERD